MTDKTAKITINFKYRNIEETFTASPEEAWLALNKLFASFLPSFEIANKLWLNVDLKKLVEECTGLIAFSKEGPNLLIPKNKLTDSETLLLWLLAAYIGQNIGLTRSDSLSKKDLQEKLGKSSKITSTRLGELLKSEMVAKRDGSKFRLTTLGAVLLETEILAKIKAKNVS